MPEGDVLSNMIDADTDGIARQCPGYPEAMGLAAGNTIAFIIKRRNGNLKHGFAGELDRLARRRGTYCRTPGGCRLSAFFIFFMLSLIFQCVLNLCFMF